MSFPFDPQQGLIIVPVELWGSNYSAVLRLALDTSRSGPAKGLISKQMPVEAGSASCWRFCLPIVSCIQPRD